MGEFKRIREVIAVPSLVTLIYSAASITLSYGMLFGSPVERITGYFLFALGTALALWNIFSHDASRDGAPSRARVAFLFLLLPLALASLPGLKIHQLRAQSGPVAVPATALVREVRMLRYSMEARLEIPVGNSGKPLSSMAYFPVDAGLRNGDIIEIKKTPRPCGPYPAANSFARGHIRKGTGFALTVRDEDYRIIRRAPIGSREIVRTRLRERIERLFNTGTAALLKGLYFGNKNFIGKDVVHHFTRAGVLHILAASGSHLATLAFLPFFLLGFARVDRRMIFLPVTVLLAAYLYVTEIPVSLQRAFIMFTIGGAHLLFDYERNTLNALYLSAAVILAVSPWELYQLGFQLTFGATLGILLFYRSFNDSLSILPGFLRAPLALTLSAQSLVFPILALWLGEVNIISPVSNLVIVPLIQFAFAASAGILALDTVLPDAAGLLAFSVEWSFAAARYSAEFFSSTRGHFTPGEAMPWLLLPYLLYLAPVIAARSILSRMWPCTPLACLLSWYILAWPPSPAGTVTLVETPRTRAAFIIRDGEAHLAGKIGSAEDARLIAKMIGNGGASKTWLTLTGIDYRNGYAAASLVRTLHLGGCAISGDYTYGRYLERVLSILERDGVALEFRGKKDTSPRTGMEDDADIRAKADREETSTRLLSVVQRGRKADRKTGIHYIGLQTAGVFKTGEKREQDAHGTHGNP